MAKYLVSLLLIGISASVCAQEGSSPTHPTAEKVCFAPTQLERGVKLVKFPAEKDVEVFLLSQPLQGQNVDCSANAFAYPFFREAHRKPSEKFTEGIWFGPEGAELALKRNWKHVDIHSAQRYDVVVWRDEASTIVQVGSVNEVVLIDSDRWAVDVEIKPNSTPPLRFSFEGPAEWPAKAEVWRRFFH